MKEQIPNCGKSRDRKSKTSSYGVPKHVIKRVTQILRKCMTELH